MRDQGEDDTERRVALLCVSNGRDDLVVLAGLAVLPAVGALLPVAEALLDAYRPAALGPGAPLLNYRQLVATGLFREEARVEGDLRPGGGHVDVVAGILSALGAEALGDLTLRRARLVSGARELFHAEQPEQPEQPQRVAV